jgi:hypothetical protein
MDNAMRAYAENWKAVAPVLRALRDEATRTTDNAAVIAEFDGLFEAAVERTPPSPYSGLLDFQERIARLPAR